MSGHTSHKAFALIIYLVFILLLLFLNLFLISKADSFEVRFFLHFMEYFL